MKKNSQGVIHALFDRISGDGIIDDHISGNSISNGTTANGGSTNQGIDHKDDDRLSCLPLVLIITILSLIVSVSYYWIFS